MKRVLCALLVVAMMLSFVPAMGVQTFADTPSVDIDFDDLLGGTVTPNGIISVEIRLPALVPGQSVPAKPQVEIPTKGLSYTANWGTNTQAPTGDTVFQLGKVYFLTLTLTADQDYSFSPDYVEMNVVGNYSSISCEQSADDTVLTIWLGVESGYGEVDSIALSGLPGEIVPGTAQTPALTNTDGQVQITKTQWVDTNKQAVTTFQDGKAYYLAVTVAPINGRSFVATPAISCGTHTYEFAKQSERQATIYIRYSLEPVVVQRGTCGAKLTWTLDNKGTLTISGTGAMNDFTTWYDGGKLDYTDLPWYTNRLLVQTAIIENGVTTIGKMAFYGCNNLNSVTIPNSVQTIGVDAFTSCSLTSVTIPDSVMTINEYAFWHCEELTSITIGNGVNTIGEGAFGYCEKLAGIWVAENNTAYSSDTKGVLFNKDKTQLIYAPKAMFGSYTIPDGVISIGDDAFCDCDSLTSVNIGDSVTTIGDYAFSGCTSLTDVYFNGTQTQWNAIDKGRENDALENANIHFAMIEKLSAPKVTVSGNALTWAAVENADSYEIYRATKKTGKYTKVATTAETSWQDSVVGKVYYYQVKAIYSADTTLNSDFSAVASVTLKANAPQISVENDSKGKPAISWSKVTGAKKYTVYRATSETGKYSKLGTTTKLTYTDSKAKAGTTYFYKVIANASSSKYNSGYSNIVSCGVICGTPTVTVKIDANTGKPSLSWKKVDGAAKYAIYRDGELLTTTTALTYADNGAAIDTQYTYTVQAMGKTEDLNGNPSKAVTATSGIAKPTIKGSIDAVSGKPVLTWAAVEGAVKYEVYRSTKSNKSYSLVATVEELTYTDTSVSAGKTYYYQVKAVGEVSKSANSSYVKLTGKCATPVITVESNAKAQPVISWEKVSGAKKYTVYRSTSETSGYKSIGTSKTTSYTDTKATPGSVYYYKVIANASSSKYNSGYSNIVSCGVYCATPVVKVSNNASGAPVISWSKVTGAAKYKVTYQMGYLGGREPEIIEEYTTSTSYTIKNVSTGMFGWVQVVAVAKNEAFSSQPSEEMEVNVLPATPKVKGKAGASGKPVLSWDYTGDVTYYEIYRSTKSGSGYQSVGVVNLMEDGEPAAVLTYEDTTAVKGKTYYYKVIAHGWYADSAMSSYVKVKCKK